MEPQAFYRQYGPNSDPGEFALPDGGIVTVKDLESGEQITLDAFHTDTRKAYARRQQRAYDQIKAQFKSANIDCVEVSTQASAADALTRYFRFREQRKR